MEANTAHCRFSQPGAKKKILTAILEAKKGVKLPDLAAALAKRDIAGAINAVPWDSLSKLDVDFTKDLEAVLIKAANAAAKTPTWAEIHAPLFNASNPASLAWAQNHAAELVRINIVEGGQQAIRELVERAWTEGIPPEDLARMIREYIGLLPKQAAAVQKYLAERLKKVSQAAAQRGADAYARKLLNLRARTIARHETMTAANRGQQELWNQARGQGYLPDDEWERKWLVTPDDRLCRRCAPMQGKRAPVNGSFEADGKLIAAPPLHVQCRCCMRLTRKILATAA